MNDRWKFWRQPFKLRYRGGHECDSETSLNFLQVLFSLLPSSLHYCEDRSHLQFFIRSSNIRYSYIYSRPDSSLHGFITKTMTCFQMECSTNWANKPSVSWSFVHHIKGLLRTNKMTSSQLEENFAPVSQRSWVQLPYEREFFLGFILARA